VEWLHGFLYGEEGYQVSDIVVTYSNKIAKDTQGAVPEELTDADHT
jgi:hypothetical protein